MCIILYYALYRIGTELNMVHTYMTYIYVHIFKNLKTYIHSTFYMSHVPCILQYYVLHNVHYQKKKS